MGNKRIIVRELQSDDDCDTLSLHEHEDQRLITFIQKDAKQLHDHSITRTHVIADGKKVLAYVSLTCTELSLKTDEGGVVRKKAQLGTALRKRRYQVKNLPGVRLARLAADKSHRGKTYQYGRELIELAISIAQSVSDKCGCRFILLDSVPEKIDYYRDRYGFELIDTEENKQNDYPTMFLDLKNK